MPRSLILMTLLKLTGITAWVDETRSSSIIAIMCGFEPEDTLRELEPIMTFSDESSMDPIKNRVGISYGGASTIPAAT